MVSLYKLYELYTCSRLLTHALINLVSLNWYVSTTGGIESISLSFLLPLGLVSIVSLLSLTTTAVLVRCYGDQYSQ